MLKRLFVAAVMAVALGAGASRALAEPETSGPRAANNVTAEADRALPPHAEASEHGNAEHKPALIPNPLDKETQKQAIWVIIIFVILLAILYPTAWKSVLAGLKKREERIRHDIAEAEAARARAEATLREYNTQLATAEKQVREMISKAAIEGEQVASQMRTRAQQEGEETKERALRDIEIARTQAISDIYEQAAVLATTVAEKIIRRNLNPEDQRVLVAQSLEQLQALGKH